MRFEMELPEIIRFGMNCRLELSSLLPPGPVLIVCGRHSQERIHGELKALIAERPVAFAENFPAEPPLPAVDAAVALGRKIGACSVVGWGGGSAMDGAKAAAALLDAPLKTAEYFYNRAVPEKRNCFLALIPTSAGTGAEVTSNAVLLDPETGIKQSLRAPGMIADAALVDPVLLAGTPSSVMASSGFDALTQALESFTSRRANALTMPIALSAAKLLLGALERACRGDVSAYEDMARGSLLAGIAFGTSGLGAAHGLGHPIGSLCHIPHGVCCAVLLIPVMRYNLKFAPERFAQLAAGLGYPSAGAMIDAVAELRRAVGIPENFHAYGLTEEQFPFIVKNCRSGSMKCNPSDFSDEAVEEFLGALL